MRLCFGCARRREPDGWCSLYHQNMVDGIPIEACCGADWAARMPTAVEMLDEILHHQNANNRQIVRLASEVTKMSAKLDGFLDELTERAEQD